MSRALRRQINAQRGRNNKRVGEDAEKAAIDELIRLGFSCVQRIGTPWRVVRNGNRIISAMPAGQVAGDITALWGGTGVLAECKRRDKPLIWSDLARHQHEHLAEYVAALGIGLVIWVWPHRGVLVLDYKRLISMGWKKGAPGLDFDKAAKARFQG